MRYLSINNLLVLDKKLIVIIGKDEKLKKLIEKAVQEHRKDFSIVKNRENNLHPYGQCRLIEAIAINAQIQKKLVITNSPYFVDHLINLMKAAKSKNKKRIREKFILKSELAFIHQKDVAVFDCEDGKIKSILKRNGHIEWRTFSKVSEWVCDLYFDMEDK